MQFKELNILPEILKALEKENYAVPTPIQEKGNINHINKKRK